MFEFCYAKLKLWNKSFTKGKIPLDYCFWGLETEPPLNTRLSDGFFRNSGPETAYIGQ